MRAFLAAAALAGSWLTSGVASGCCAAKPRGGGRVRLREEADAASGRAAGGCEVVGGGATPLPPGPPACRGAEGAVARRGMAGIIGDSEAAGVVVATERETCGGGDGPD
jgi:hypothetical protein